MANNPCCFAKCLDCGARTKVRRSVFQRATRARCAKCGGPIDPSSEAAKDMARGVSAKQQADARREKADKV
jgi:hypothetical protein